MVLIGLTGGIASGKSAAHQVIESKGYPVVDADVLSRQAVAKGSPGLGQVIEKFGSEYLAADGELDRKALGEKVFGDPEKLSQLEKIVHPLVRQRFAEIKTEWQGAGEKVGFYVVPLLFEKEMEDLFDQTLLITCSQKTQIDRLMAREGMVREQAEAIIASQLPNSEKEAMAHHVIVNDTDLEQLSQNIEEYLKSLPSLDR